MALNPSQLGAIFEKDKVRGVQNPARAGVVKPVRVAGVRPAIPKLPRLNTGAPQMPHIPGMKFSGRKYYGEQ